MCQQGGGIVLRADTNPYKFRSRATFNVLFLERWAQPEVTFQQGESLGGSLLFNMWSYFIFRVVALCYQESRSIKVYGDCRQAAVARFKL